MCRRAAPFALAVVLLSPRPAAAGASLLVDDTGTTPDGHCQLESWLRARPGSAEATAVPACGYGGVEYSLGMTGYGGAASGPWPTAGLKRTLREMGDDTPVLSIALGGMWRRPDDRLASVTANLAASFPLRPQWTLYANLGWNAYRGESPRPGGGLGLEFDAGPHWGGLGELYAERGRGHAMQAGLRRLLPHGVSCDLLAGHDRTGRWLTFGFNYSPGDS